MKKLLWVLLAASCAFAREGSPELAIDVDFFDNLEVVKPYAGKDWIEAFFAKCESNGVKRVTWRCSAQIANYRTKLNYTMDDVQAIKSACDERRFSGAFACKVGVKPGKGRKLPGFEKVDFGGIAQKITPKDGNVKEYFFRALISSDPIAASGWFGSKKLDGAFIAAVDAATGKVLAKSEPVSRFEFRRRDVTFKANAPFWIGIFSKGSDDIHVFVADAVSCRAGDAPDTELAVNGDFEETTSFLEPVAWEQTGACFAVFNGDVRNLPEKQRKERFPNINSFDILHHPFMDRIPRIVRAVEDGDTLALAGQAALRHGVKLYAWYDPFDDGRRCLPPVKVWSDRFMEEHPECRLTDKDGHARWGLLCFACPEVRAHKRAVVEEILSYPGVYGIALKTHFQHNLSWGMDSSAQVDSVYHPAIIEQYHKVYGVPPNGEYSLFLLRKLHGEAFMQWLEEIHPLFAASGKHLCMFQAPNVFLDRTCTSALYLPPQEIVERGLCDDMLIEPRWIGEHVNRFRSSDFVKDLVAACRRKNIGVGFDYYYAGVGRDPAVKDTRKHLLEQVSALGKEDVDWIGVYEEICLNAVWPELNAAAKNLAAIGSVPGYVPSKAADPGKITPENSSIFVTVPARKLRVSAEDLAVQTPGPEGLCFTMPEVVAEISMKEPQEMSEVAIYSGNLCWRNQCPLEDFTLEAFADGKWKTVADVKGAFALKGSDNAKPNVCTFAKRRVEKLRLKVLRSAFDKCVVIRSVQGK